MERCWRTEGLQWFWHGIRIIWKAHLPSPNNILPWVLVHSHSGTPRDPCRSKAGAIQLHDLQLPLTHLLQEDITKRCFKSPSSSTTKAHRTKREKDNGFPLHFPTYILYRCTNWGRWDSWQQRKCGGTWGLWLTQKCLVMCPLLLQTVAPTCVCGWFTSEMLPKLFTDKLPPLGFWGELTNLWPESRWESVASEIVMGEECLYGRWVLNGCIFPTNLSPHLLGDTSDFYYPNIVSCATPFTVFSIACTHGVMYPILRRMLCSIHDQQLHHQWSMTLGIQVYLLKSWYVYVQ